VPYSGENSPKSLRVAVAGWNPEKGSGNAMKKLTASLKTLLSSLMALAVLTVFSLTSYAAPDASPNPSPASPEAVMADKDAVLMANGTVTVNGNEAKTGITVLSGSLVKTGANSIAMIESSVFGRVTLGPDTIAKITYSGVDLKIEPTCNDMRVACKEGQCTVTDKNGVAKVLTTGQDEHFDNAVVVTSNAWVDVVVNCGRDVVCPPPMIPVVASTSLLPVLLILGGVLTGTTIAVIARPKDSPTQP
jgi:hypothetical protein